MHIGSLSPNISHNMATQGLCVDSLPSRLTTTPVPAPARFQTGRPKSLGWQTRFGRLVGRYGVAKLARDLQIEQTAIYQWVWGETSPRHEKVLLILSLLKPVGKIKIEDIYQHRLIVKGLVQANAKLA
jgi:hypothetical protein